MAMLGGGDSASSRGISTSGRSPARPPYRGARICEGLPATKCVALAGRSQQELIRKGSRSRRLFPLCAQSKQGLRRDGDGAGGLGGRDPYGVLPAPDSNSAVLGKGPARFLPASGAAPAGPAAGCVESASPPGAPAPVLSGRLA